MKGAAAVLVVLLAGLAAGCTGDDRVEPLATSACTKLLYEGDGEPDVVIVSDFPLRGIGAQPTRLMVDAVEFILRQRGFRAGEHRVGFQSCNDTFGEEPYDPALCRRNARAYVAAKDVVGIIGPWNSGCALEQIPIISRKAAGPLAMVSPSNTFIGLTRPVRGEASGPALYPDGVRSYARVVTHDHAQGIAAAQLAASLGARRAVVLRQNLEDAYVNGLTTGFVKTAKALGLTALQLEWPLRQSYTQLAAAVAARRPDVVYMAGLPQENGKTLVQDLRAELGPDIPLITPDSFSSEEIARELGPAGEAMFVTVPGIPPDKLPAAGRQFVRAFGKAISGSIGVPEAAQATQVLLDAIGRSDGSRASVVEELFATKIENGILGSFSFDRFGDIVPAPVGIYRFRDGKIVVEGVVRAPLDAIGG